MKKENDLLDIEPLDLKKERAAVRRKNIELILSVALVLVIMGGGGILFARAKSGGQGSEQAVSQEEIEALRAEIDNLNKKIDEVNNSLNMAKSAVSETQAVQAQASSGATIGGLVNINTAGVSELDSLPGIGPAYAQRIIDYRSAQGGFKSTADLQNVKGIGPKTYEKLKELVTI